jgi:hypothetical protein
VPSRQNLARAERADNRFGVTLANDDINRSGLDKKCRRRTVTGAKNPIAFVVVLAI